MKNKIRLLICCLLPIYASADAEILKWVDEDGKVHYGDARQMRGRAEVVKTKISSYEHVTITQSKSAAGSDVVMYSTTSCGYCKQARRYFKQNDIAFAEHFIDKDRAARRTYDKLGEKGVPVILVGDARMTGFSVPAFEKLYKRVD